MTWAGEAAFRSGFYFSDIRSRWIDLEFIIEGTDPVWIDSISVHARPDAMYRLFENGLILANPSPRPYRFDLAELFPGTSFRRLRGSPGQDRQANSGNQVQGKITLGPREGLFLVKEY